MEKLTLANQSTYHIRQMRYKRKRRNEQKNEFPFLTCTTVCLLRYWIIQRAHPNKYYLNMGKKNCYAHAKMWSIPFLRTKQCSKIVAKTAYQLTLITLKFELACNVEEYVSSHFAPHDLYTFPTYRVFKGKPRVRLCNLSKNCNSWDVSRYNFY